MMTSDSPTKSLSKTRKKSSRVDHHKLSQFVLVAACIVGTAGLASFLSNLYALSFIEEQIERSAKKRNSHSFIDQDGYQFHYVVSSGCNSLQDWQSYAWFYHIMATGFRGNVTRVASCETEDQANALRKLHKEQIHGPMSKRFNLHITPDYSHLTTPKYNFFNKPFGIRHWLEEGLGFPYTAKHDPAMKKTIFVLMDPDQFLMRPFVRDMNNEEELYHSDKGYRVIQEGQPFGALYGMGGRWVRKINVTELLEHATEHTATSGLLTWNETVAMHSYAVGAPYVVMASDFYAIVRQWSDFVVPLHHQMIKEPFMAEMYAYSAAAAHLNLPHQLTKSFMISDPESPEEGWEDWIDSPLTKHNNLAPLDEVKAEHACSQRMQPIHHALHFCQRIFIGPYFFSKYQVPSKPEEGDGVFLSCEHPLYQEPPLNVASLYNTSMTLDGNVHELNSRMRIRMAFGVCQMLPRLNAAARFFKNHHCPKGTANYSMTFLHETHQAKKLRKQLEQAEHEQKKTDAIAKL